MAEEEKNRSHRVKIDDPAVRRLVKMLRQDSQNGVYVLIQHEGKLVKIYRTMEMSEMNSE